METRMGTSEMTLRGKRTLGLMGFLCALLLTFHFAAVSADPLPVATPTTQTSVASDTNAYKLQVGDVLEISIYNEEGTSRVVTVDNHGNIDYLLVGTVKAVGRTIAELRNELHEKLREDFRYLVISVVPQHFGGQHFTISGEVNNPGTKPLLGSITLIEALALGGGFKQAEFRYGQVDLEDLQHAFLARNGTYVSANFAKLVLDGDMSQNVAIKDGDFIFIPNGLSKGVFVVGEVIRPSSVDYMHGETLVSAVTKAGGPTFRAGQWATIIRGSLSTPERLDVNVGQVMQGKAQDVLLKPGDIVYVAPRWLIDMEEMLTAGIRSFVSSVMHVAGEKAFEGLHPHAKDDENFDMFFP